MTLRIRLLGTFEVERDGHPIPESEWHTQQAKQVLKILVLARGRAVPSDKLMEWLWPGANPSATATTLRSTIHALRRALEPDRAPRVPSRYIVTRSPGYAFQPTEDTWVDVYRFEELLEQAERARRAREKRRLLSEALELYRGDLLEEDPYAEWALLERERLRERYLDALLALADLHAQAGELDKAIAACRRALARDEYREAAYRALMRYQALAGDVAAALNTYDRCRTMLQQEFGAEPAPQTQALYRTILSGEVQTLRPKSAAPVEEMSPARVLLPPYELPFQEVFVGRDAELSRLRQAVEQALGGHGGVVAVTGDVGMGKTHLVLHALQHVPVRATVVGVRCLAVEQALPFAPLTHVLRRLLDSIPAETWASLPPFALAQVAQRVPALHDLLPDLPPVPDTTPEENRSRLIDGIGNVLVALSDRHPLILFLDDVQWADEATLTTLGRLAYRAPRHPLLLVLTYPTGALAEKEDLRELVSQLRHDGILREWRVEELTEEDVRTFLARVWDAPEEVIASLAKHVYEQTEGVPLYVVEVVREALSRTDEVPDPRHIPPVQNVHHIRTLILNRVERLSPEARDVLALAAVIGREFPLDVLETAATRDPLPGLEELLRHQFLVEVGDDRVAFVHEVVRQVIYASLSTLARRRLHRQVAEALIALHGPDAGPHAVNAAYHFRHAGSRYISTALRYTVLAGDYLRRTYGFREAGEHYRRALKLANHVLPDEQAQEWVRRAYMGLGLAYEALGDWEGIVTTYTALHEWAEKMGDKALALRAARRLMSALTVVGRLDEAAIMAGDVLAALGDGPAGVMREIFTRLRVVFGRSTSTEPATTLHFRSSEPPTQPEPWVEASRLLGEELAPLPLSLYGWSLALQGHLEEATACLSYAAQLAQEKALLPYAVMALHFAAHVDFLRGDLRSLQHHLDEGFRLARQVPTAGWSTLWGQVFEAYIHLHLGDVSGAEQRFRALDEALTGRQGFRAHHLSVWVGLTLVALARDDVEAAVARLDPVLARRDTLDVVSSFWSYVAEAAIARRQGDVAAAVEHAQEALRLAGQRGLLFEYASAAEELARGMSLAGEPEKALPVLEEALRVAREAQAPGVIAVAQRALTRLRSTMDGHKP
ncbi:MAG: AAA family ATPase [Chloroflexi bacterium]|nr:AAA family ATPase [Chloroflexota bacterium]